MSHPILRRTATLLAVPLLGLAAVGVAGLPAHPVVATGGAASCSTASAREATTPVVRGGAPAASTGRVAHSSGSQWRQPAGR